MLPLFDLMRPNRETGSAMGKDRVNPSEESQPQPQATARRSQPAPSISLSDLRCACELSQDIRLWSVPEHSSAPNTNHRLPSEPVASEAMLWVDCSDSSGELTACSVSGNVLGEGNTWGAGLSPGLQTLRENSGRQTRNGTIS